MLYKKCKCKLPDFLWYCNINIKTSGYKTPFTQHKHFNITCHFNLWKGHDFVSCVTCAISPSQLSLSNTAAKEFFLLGNLLGESRLLIPKHSEVFQYRLFLLEIHFNRTFHNLVNSRISLIHTLLFIQRWNIDKIIHFISWMH